MELVHDEHEQALGRGGVPRGERRVDQHPRRVAALDRRRGDVVRLDDVHETEQGVHPVGAGRHAVQDPGDEIAHREASSRAVSRCLARSRTRAGQPGASTAARIRARAGAGSRRVISAAAFEPLEPRGPVPEEDRSRPARQEGDREHRLASLDGVGQAAPAGVQRNDGGQRQDLEDGVRHRLEAATGGIAAPRQARRVDAERPQQGLGRTRVVARRDGQYGTERGHQLAGRVVRGVGHLGRGAAGHVAEPVRGGALAGSGRGRRGSGGRHAAASLSASP